MREAMLPVTPRNRMLRFLLAALAAAAVPLAVAQPITPAGAGPQVELAAEASREVANDLMTATLFATAEGSDPAPLQGQINRAVSEALRVAAEFREVKARSGGSQTFPVYDRNNRQTGWRGRGEIRLEGRDFQQMAQLVARLQSTMQLGGL